MEQAANLQSNFPAPGSSRRNSNRLGDRRSSFSNTINTASTASGPGGICPCLRVHCSDWLGCGLYVVYPKLNAEHCVWWNQIRDSGFSVTQMWTHDDFTITARLHSIK